MYFNIVADLNECWNVHLVTSTSYEITALKWDVNSGNSLVFADMSGQVEVWQMKEFLLSDWHCIHKSMYKSENFLTVFFIGSARKIYINMDKNDAVQYHEKFDFRPAPSLAQGFGERDMFGIMLVSHSGLVVCLALPTCNSNPMEALCAKQCLNVTRNRVRTVDVSFVKDGSLLIAASNGDPLDPIRFYKVNISWIDRAFDDGLELCLKLEIFPGIYYYFYYDFSIVLIF